MRRACSGPRQSAVQGPRFFQRSSGSASYPSLFRWCANGCVSLHLLHMNPSDMTSGAPGDQVPPNKDAAADAAQRAVIGA